MDYKIYALGNGPTKVEEEQPDKSSDPTLLRAIISGSEVQFEHYQTGKRVGILGNFESSPLSIWDNSDPLTCNLIIWDSLVVLPRFVCFIDIDGKFLKARFVDNRDHR